MYECNQVGPKSYNCRFCQLVWYSSDVCYCTDSYYLKNCFGCAGLKKEEYCILNKRCRPEEYKRLLQEIVDRMQETGEWGEFFPLEMSPHPYNLTMAQRFFPITALGDDFDI